MAEGVNKSLGQGPTHSNTCRDKPGSKIVGIAPGTKHPHGPPHCLASLVAWLGWTMKLCVVNGMWVELMSATSKPDSSARYESMKVSSPPFLHCENPEAMCSRVWTATQRATKPPGY